MPKQIVSLPAIFEKMTPRKDRSWKLEIATRELEPKDVQTLAARLGSEGYWLNSPNDDFDEDDVPTEEVRIKGEKTLDEMYRRVLYVYYKQHPEIKKPFNEFVRERYERQIQLVKDQLEPND